MGKRNNKKLEKDAKKDKTAALQSKPAKKVEASIKGKGKEDTESENYSSSDELSSIDETNVIKPKPLAKQPAAKDQPKKTAATAAT